MFRVFDVLSLIWSVWWVRVPSCDTRHVGVWFLCVVTWCSVLCYVVVVVVSSLRASRGASAGVLPDTGLGENAGAAIGKALEKNTSLVKLDLVGAPLVCSFWLSRTCI